MNTLEILISKKEALKQLCINNGVTLLSAFPPICGTEKCDTPGDEVELLVRFEEYSGKPTQETVEKFKKKLEDFTGKTISLKLDKPLKNPHLSKSFDGAKIVLYAEIE